MNKLMRLGSPSLTCPELRGHATIEVKRISDLGDDNMSELIRSLYSAQNRAIYAIHKSVCHA